MKGPCVKENMPRFVACVEEKRGEKERDVRTQKIRLPQPGLWRQL